MKKSNISASISNYFRNNIEIFILLIGWVIITILNLAIIFIAYFYNLVITSDNNAINIISLNTQIIATIFAISISLTVIGFQFLSQSLTPRIIYLFIKSKFILGLFISFASIILFNLFILIFPEICNIQIFVVYSYFLLVWCIFYLIAYFVYVITSVQPFRVMDLIRNELPTNYQTFLLNQKKMMSGKLDESNRYTDLEQIIIKTIRKNDFMSFHRCYSIIVSNEIDILQSIKKLKPDKKEGYTIINKKIDTITSFFSYLYTQIYYEISKEKNETLLITYMSGQVELVKILIKLKAWRSKGTLANHLNDVGFSIIKHELEGLTQDYEIFQRTVVKEEYDAVPFGTFSPDVERPFSDLSEIQKDEQMIGRFFFDHVTNRLTFFEAFAIEAAKQDFWSFVQWSKESVSEMITKIISQEKLWGSQKILLMNSLHHLKNINKKIIEKKYPTNFFGLMDLHYKIDVMKIKDTDLSNKYKELFTDYYCERALQLIKKDTFMTPNDLGAEGRHLVKNYPNLVEKIVMTLIEGLKIVRENQFENIKEEEIITQLKSIRDWNDHPHISLKKLIDDNLNK